MNPKLRALLERKQKASTAARKLHEAAEMQDRELTAAEVAQFDAHIADVEKINFEIAREQKAIEGERTARPLPRDPGAFPGGGEYPQYLDERQAPTGRRYAQLFPDAGIDAGGFRSFGEFASAIRSGMADPRIIMAATGGSGTSGADGGALIPAQFVAELLDDSLETEIVRPRATVRPMTTSSLWVAGWDLLDHSVNIGGFDAKWADEGQAFAFQKAKTRPLNLKAHKLGILTAATNELLGDSSFYSNELPELMVKAIGFGMDEAFLRGDGVAKPRGVLNDPALITVTKEAAQSPDTIVWANIAKMYERLHPNSRKSAVWVVSSTATMQLLQMFTPVTNIAGTENVAGVPMRTLNERDGSWSMLGLPAIFTEKLPILGDLGDIVLADFSQYIIGLRKDMTVDRSGHLLFDSDETAFRAIMRADGMGRWNAPMIPRNGSAANSQSWCVTLEVRA